MTRWFRSGLAVSAPFVWRCLNSRSACLPRPRRRQVLRFAHPAQRTGRAVFPASGSRTSINAFAHGIVACLHCQPDQAQRIVEDLVRDARRSLSQCLVPVTRPLAEPMSGVGIHTPEDFADLVQDRSKCPSLPTFGSAERFFLGRSCSNHRRAVASQMASQICRMAFLDGQSCLIYALPVFGQ